MGQISEREDAKRAIKWYGSNKWKFNFDKFIIFEFSYKTKSEEKDSSEEFFAKATAIKNEEMIVNNELIFWVQHDIELSPRYETKDFRNLII